MRFLAAAPRSRGRAATAALAFMLFLTALAIAPVPAVAVPDETFADDFSPAGFNGSDGTMPWATDWIEAGESDGFDAGTIQVRNEPHCETDPCLTLGRDAGPDASLEREANLSDFAAATLTFFWDVHEHGIGWGWATLSISDNGGADWDQLDSWLLTNEVSNQTASYDISEYLAADTRIRFSVNSNWDESHLNIDNLAIEANYWVQQPTPTSEDLWTVQFPADDQIGYVGGGNGVILKTVNGGETWVEQATPASSTVRGIDFPVDATTGYAVGSSDTVMKTINGVDWEMQATPTDVTLEDVDFIDNATGFAVGDSGTILKTVDGGTTWVEKPSGTSENLRGVAFPVDAQTGYAVGTNGTILRTTDGGDSWETQSSGTTRNLNAVQFPVDTSVGYIVANSGELLTTVDGGSSWMPSTPSGDDLRALHFPQDAQHGHVATDNGNVLDTDSSGSSWATEPVPTSLDLLGIWFNSLTRGWVVGRSGLIYATGPNPMGAGANSPPVFDQDLLDRTDDEGTLIDIGSPATDPDAGDSLTYSATGLPNGISIDPGSGDITGVLTPTSSGTHAVAITVTDDGDPAMVDTDDFTWTVNEGEATYLVSAEGGGPGGNEAQLSAVDRTDGNPATNEVTIGDSTGRTNIEGLAFQPVTNILFGSHGDQLGTIDVITGVFTSLPETAGVGNGSDGPQEFDNIEALSFDPATGNLYASHRPGSGSIQSLLLQIDPGTGAHVPGAFDGDDYVEIQRQGSYYQVPGMAHDPTDGTLYIIHWDDIGGENWEIATVDPTTGATTQIGSVPDNLTGLSFSGDGELFGITDEPGDGTLYGINKATGAVTSTITVDNTHDYEAVAIAYPPLPNMAPVFDQDLLDRTDPEGTLIDIDATATDPNLADTLTYVAAGLPEGVLIDSATGILSGALGPNAAGVYPITITVSDNGTPSLQDTDTFTWTVTPGEVTYLVANSGGGNGGDDLLTAVDLTDPDPATNEVSIGAGTGTSNIEAVALQPGTNTLFAVEDDRLGTIDVTTGVFTPKPAIAGAGSGSAGLIAFDNIEGLSFHPFTGDLFASHRRSGSSEDLLLQLDPVSGAHLPGAFGGDDYVAIENQGSRYHVPAIAHDPTDGMLYAIHTDNGFDWRLATVDPATGATTTRGGLPDALYGLNFDGSGQLFGTTAYGFTERIRQINKADGSSLASINVDNGRRYEAIAIAFPAEPNRPPIFNQNLLDRTDPEGSTISLSAAATDPDGHGITYSATGLPPGLSIDPGSGLITGIIDYSASATGPYAVEIAVTDDGIPNLTTTDTFTWTVSELNRPPVFDQDLLDRSDPEGTAISISASATDPDIGTTLTYGATGLPSGLSIDPGSGEISGTIDYTAATGSPYTVTITATDDGIPTESATPDTFTWTVTNTNRPPAIVSPGPQTAPEFAPFTVVLTASDPDGTIPSFSDAGTLPAWAVLTDNLDGTATIAGTPGGGASGTTTVTITASDGDLTDDAVFDLTITNVNQPPSVTNPGNQFGAEGTPFSIVVTASDPDGTTVGFSDGGTLPAWATLTDNGDNTATISGTPGYSDAATSTVTITVSDGPETDSAVFDITISNTNRAPTVDPIGDQSVAENDPFTLVVTASDPDGTVPSLAASGLPGWASFVDNSDGTGTITGTPGFGDSAVSSVTITASDGVLPGSTAFDLTVVDTNRAPVVSPIPDQFVAEGEALVPVVVTAADPDGTIPSLAATGLPSWASFVDNGDGTGTISGVPGYDDAAVRTVTITAEDGGVPNLADSKTFDLTVTDTNRAPAFNQDLLDRMDPEATTVSVSAAATDPDLDGLTYVAISLPPGLSINPTSGLITGTLTYAAAGVYPVEITVTDDGTPTLDAIDTFVWTVTNTNRAPVANPISDQIVAENDPFALTVTGSDPDGGIVGFSDAGTLPSWATLTDNGDNTATVTGTPGYSDAGTTGVVITVSDGLLTTDAQFDLQVTDTNRPPVVDPVADQAAVEFEALTPVLITATDPDGTLPSLIASGLPSWAIFVDHGNGTGTLAGTPGSGDAGVSTVTITASDGDLIATDEFVLTVAEGNRPPTFGMSLPDRSDAEGDVIFINATASDLDGDNLSYSATGLPAGISIDPANGEIAGMLSYDSAGSYTVVVAVDDDGVPPLRASAVFDWTVADTNRAPILVPIASVLGPEMTELTFPAVANDPDGHHVTYSIAGAPPGAAIDPETGVFSWTPDEVHGEGSYGITVIASDSGVPSLVDTKTVTITVTEVNRPPTVDRISDQGNAIGDAVDLQVVAADPDIPLNSIAYAASGLPAGLSIDAGTGAITGRIAADAADTNYVTVTVTDDGSPAKSGKTTFKWMVGGENRPPVMERMSDRTVAELSPVTIRPSVSDPDGDTITYEIAGAPPGSSFDPATGTLRWTPSEEQGPGSYRLSIIAADDGDPQLVTIGVVTVNATEVNTPPVIEAPLDRADDAGDTVSLQILAEDSDLPANTLSFSATELPPGLTIDPATGVVRGQIEVTTEEVTSYAVTVTVTDDGEPALEATTTFTWTVIGQDVVPENFPPSVDPIAAQTSDAGATVELQVRASDPDPLTYLAEGLPAGLRMDSATGLISGTVTAEALGTHAVVVTVADNAEPPLRTAVSFTWTVTDRNAADQKDDMVVAIVDIDPGSDGSSGGSDDVESRPLRRGLVVMSTAAAATTESLRLPFVLLLALMAGFATIGRIGLYPLLWRGERQTGLITFFDDEIGFGLIHPDEGGEDVFVHAHAFPRRQRRRLAAGLRLRYRVLASDNRSSAWGATLEGVKDE